VKIQQILFLVTALLLHGCDRQPLTDQQAETIATARLEKLLVFKGMPRDEVAFVGMQYQGTQRVFRWVRKDAPSKSVVIVVWADGEIAEGLDL
jgi:hypothetical protein